MTTYKCTEYFDDEPVTFFLDCDMSQASAPISFSYEDDADDDWGWQHTPFQTADACHDIAEAARLASDYANEIGGDEAADRVGVEHPRD